MKWPVACLFLFLFGCKKEKSCESCLPGSGGISAMVVYNGSVAGDGCEWNILTSTGTVHPDNLPADFMVNPLDVEVNYTGTGDFYVCGLIMTKIPVVHITSIRKR